MLKGGSMETVLIALINLLSFYLGAKIGQTVAKGEKLEIPTPVKVIEEVKETRERKKEQDKLNTMLENINNYDGTGAYQKDIE
jgi:hypothetical protein